MRAHATPSTTPAVDPGLEAQRLAREAAARERLRPISGEYPFAPRFFAHPSESAARGAWQHYLDEGPRETRAVVFVHGNPTWSFAWRRAIAALSRRRRCVAPDHVGCGLSDKPGAFSYRLEAHVENLERLLLGLGLERITLVVHDWGGPIGLGFARRHPGRVERLVVTNTAAFPLAAMGSAAPPAEPVAGAAQPGDLVPTPALRPLARSAAPSAPRLPFPLALCRLPVFGKLAVRGLNAFARGATWMAVEKPLPAAVKRGYLLPYDSWRNRVATHEFVADIPLAPAHPSWAELNAIERSLGQFADRPVQILWGLRDWVFTPAFLDEWTRRLPHAVATRFEHAGHYLFEDESEGFLRELLGFVEP